MTPLQVLDELDAVTIPVACPVPWDSMTGGPRTRFCDQCKQNVHDIGELTRAEALGLLRGGENTCFRVYQRPDGRVLTADCMSRRERAWKRLLGYSALAAAAFAVLFWMFVPQQTQGAPCRFRDDEPTQVVEEGAEAIVTGIQSETAPGR